MECCAVGVEQELPPVKSVAFVGVVGSFDAKCVELAIGDTLDPHMPHISRAVPLRVELDSHGRFGIFGPLEQFQPNTGGVAAEKREVDSTMAMVGARWRGPANINLDRFGHFRFISSIFFDAILDPEPTIILYPEC
jgi:hypothetical protein